ncbi:hypothetical protein F511_16597 [Dorcoceras hygrometricum]|uniref:Uncharacterized protein n=1 Tax=Dorcoceras hygrometricum TaxID=472368 RepID=A0A2Z7CH13_9LAMI|nr:hypothetical protein F511_16597 [Dorcoceras hygrometricum]
MRADRYERVHVRRRLVVARWLSVWSRSGVVLRSELLSVKTPTGARLALNSLVETLPLLPLSKALVKLEKSAKELQCVVVRRLADLILLLRWIRARLSWWLPVFISVRNVPELVVVVWPSRWHI